jgi:thiamine-monophosphate kinase
VPLQEKALINRIRRLAGPRAGAVRVGIGDDCAVLRLPSGHEVLVTTDFSMEGVHFRRDWHPADSVGHRTLTRGLSDIAAMGGTPSAAFLSLALPQRLPQRWVDGFFSGFGRLARKFKVHLAGGDVAESPAGILADVMVIGSAPAGKAIRRFGARAGDYIYVTGQLGASAAVLEKLRIETKLRASAAVAAPHFYPQPRVGVGQVLLRNKLASAAIDVSDGLSTDLSHICEQSGVGAVVYGVSLPLGGTLQQALHGGEDYELLFTAPAQKLIPSKIAGVPITRIGEVTQAMGMWIADGNGRRKRLAARGWQHFKASF